jgi:allantoin racemase
MQRIAVLGSGTARSELPEFFSALAPTGFMAWAAPIRLSAFARSPYERLIVDVGYVDAGQNAAAAGCAAVFINSFADYGLAALRAVLTVPVIGAGEAALLEAARAGRRFAIVTVWPQSMNFLYVERLQTLQLGAQCVAIENFSPEAELLRLGQSDGIMERMQRHETGVVAALLACCERVIRERAAECIVLGCTCMAPIAPQLSAGCSRPVIDSARSGFGAALQAARTAATATATGGPVASAPQTLVDIVTAWQEANVPGSPAEQCEPCATIN